MDDEVRGPLHDLVVIDCSSGSAGPLATCILADNGATVVKVEPPGGDPFRARSTDHVVFDRGKHSIVLDLHHPDAAEVMDRLLARADVFVESWSPGTAEQLGLGPDRLAERFPRLVACSISGYGADDRRRDEPGYDSLVAAAGGLMAEQLGFRDGPVFSGFRAASVGAGLLGAMGILAALHTRDDDGLGQHVETSLYDGLLGFMAYWYGSERPLRDDRLGVDPTRRMIAHPMRCRGGDYLWVHTAAMGSHKRLMQLLGLADRIQPASGPVEAAEPLGEAEADVLWHELPRIFATRDRAEWLELLAGADVAGMPALRPGEVLDEVQVRHNGMTVTVVDPDLGPLLQVATAAKLGLTPAPAPAGAPHIGEHTGHILGDAGFDDAAVDRLRAAGVVA